MIFRNIFLTLVLLISTCVVAQTFTIPKINTAIEIDGVANEMAWSQIEAMGDFVQNFPSDSLIAITKTVVKICYDDKGIYILCICYDDLKGKQIIQSLKRDFSVTKNDAVVISISPQNDKNTGFSFGVNAQGAQREGLIATGGIGGVTTAWDNKWLSETKQYADKWITEMFIPFKTLRFKNGSQDWGLNVARFDYKRNETSTWSRVPKGLNISHLGFMGIGHFELPLKKTGLNTSIIPYAVGGASYTFDNKKVITKNLAAVGGDVKLGITSSLNLDLTANPDFAQVEVDDQVINLDRFELFFPERRQFFIENADMFDQFGFSRIKPFFSRRIGLSNGKIIPIAAGLRLSGNIDRNWRIGLMNMQTLQSTEAKTNPQNFSIVALTRRVLDRSFVGVIATHKQIISDTSKSFNSLVGTDFNFLSKNNYWRGKFFYHHTFTPLLKKDAGATAMWLMYRTSKWNIQWNHEYVGKEYTAEMGFVPRKGYFRLEPSISFTHFYKTKKLFSQSIGLYNSSFYNPYDKFKSLDQLTTLFSDLTFMNTAIFSVSYNEYQTRLRQAFDPTNAGSTPLPVANYFYRNGAVSYTSNFRKAFNYSARITFGSYFNGLGLKYGATLNYRFQPYGSVSINVEQNEIWLPKPYKNGSLTLVNFKTEISFTRAIFFNSILQYNTQAKSFGTNLRLQWRFKPMSDVFIVYTDNYTNSFEPRSRAFAIKLNYWFSL